MTFGDYAITEAGFGADLGAEKFYDIKCRKAGLNPKLTVLVVTARALKMHGGVSQDIVGQPNLEALKVGIANMDKPQVLPKANTVPYVAQFLLHRKQLQLLVIQKLKL